MTRILAIETATEACSAALLIDGELRERYELAPRRHAMLILPFIDALLHEADLKPQQLDAVAFGRGPGSFTGLRIAAGIAQGIAFGADLPVVSVSTLAALALTALQKQDGDAVLAAIDARMQEVYWGVYRRTGEHLVELIGAERVCAAAAVPLPEADAQIDTWIGAGTGWGSYGEVLGTRCGTPQRIYADCYPRAAAVAALGEALFQQGLAVPAQQAIPVYLRDNVANKPGA
ncbi:MAG: tRNA (adenosine(37)-N6)-threonylcarbamoyltransferase complex dimerization subunit type 1 TsaB [Thiogranum sp.]|nr:tRNA (adenosine(37)-N6)-threonylcarbamoyltransferase complex dimerization subunit type 1 TsaB [Thiogranum sp.]